MGKIEVSVLIITYNQEKYIRQTVESVMKQITNFEFEVIVGEDCSPDNTRDILYDLKKEYGDKLILILHDINVGPGKNTLAVRKAARGRYIAYLEGDDYWTDNTKLQTQYNILENNPQYYACCHDFMKVDPEGKITSPHMLEIKRDTVKTMKHWLREGYTLHTCTIFKRAFIDTESQSYRDLKACAPTMGDIITFSLIYDKGDIYVINKVMAAHREAGENDTSSFSYKQKQNSIKYTRIFYNIVNGLNTYFNNKYDFTPLLRHRIAQVKWNKMRGVYTYSTDEMRSILTLLSPKDRLLIEMELFWMILEKSIGKIKRSIWRKNESE